MLSLHSLKRILRFRGLKSLVEVVDPSRRARADSKQQWKRYNIMSQGVWFKSYVCICGHEEIFITSPDLRGGLNSVQLTDQLPTLCKEAPSQWASINVTALDASH